MREPLIVSFTYKGDTAMAVLDDEELRDIYTGEVYENIAKLRDKLVGEKHLRNTNQISKINIYYGSVFLEKYAFFRNLHNADGGDDMNLSLLYRTIVNYLAEEYNLNWSDKIEQEGETKPTKEPTDTDLDVNIIISKFKNLSLDKKQEILQILINVSEEN